MNTGLGKIENKGAAFVRPRPSLSGWPDWVCCSWLASLLILLLPGLSWGDTHLNVEPEASQLSIAVNYADDWVEGNTDPGALVSITLTDNLGTLKDQVSITTDGTGQFFIPSEDWTLTLGGPDILPGDYVYATVPGAAADVSPVGELDIYGDADNDTVSATLHANWFTGPLEVSCEVGVSPGPPGIVDTATTDGGNFECDFGALGWDLEPFQTVSVEYREPDGDRVINEVEWPWMHVNYAHDIVQANYPVGHTFTVTVTESDGVTVKATGTAESVSRGGWGGTGFNIVDWSTSTPDIQPGDLVTVESDDGYMNVVDVGQITGTVDVVADSIDGTVLAPALSGPLTVDCAPWGAWNIGLPDVEGKGDIVVPDGLDMFLCAWNPVSEWDIQPDQDIAVTYTEPDGDAVTDVFQDPHFAHLSVGQWVRGDIAEGGNLALRIRFRNDGGGGAENVTLTATPGGLAYLADTSGYSHTGTGSGPITWDLGTLEQGTVVEFVVFFEVTALNGQAVSSVLAIATTSYDGGDPSEKVAMWEGVVEANDTQLTVSKRSWTEDPAPGRDFVYAIDVCNEGATGSSELTLSDEPNEFVSLVAWWAREAGWSDISFSPDALVVTRPTVPGFACTEVYIRAHVTEDALPGDLLVNTATIAAANDLEPGDNVATHETLAGVPHFNLHITKSAGSGSPMPGGRLRYWIAYGNSGNVPLESSFQVIDTFPTGTTYESAWLHDGNAVYPFPPAELGPDHATWEMPGLDNGFTEGFELVLAVSPEVTPGTVMSNTITIEEVPGEDTYSDNAYVWHEVLHAVGPNLRVVKSSEHVPGGITYTIRFENRGNTTIENVAITDTLPVFTTWAGQWDTTFDLDRLVEFAQLDGQLIWTFSEIHPEEGGAIGFHVNFDEPEPSRSFVNTVEITLPPGDVDPSDNAFFDETFVGTLTVGGTVSGLAGTSLVLQNNGDDDLPISADGSFTFTTPLADGSTYAVTVLNQPTSPSQTCSVINGSGTLAGADITDVSVTCVTDTFAIGGTTSGLDGPGLVLQNNGGDNLIITSGGRFEFTNRLDDGSDYSVTVLTQPTSPKQVCVVSNGSGTLSSTDVTDVSVNCTTVTFSIGGNVSGLDGSGLVLQNNEGDDLSVFVDGGFTFSTLLDDGSDYAVSIKTQPTSPPQICTAGFANGTILGDDVSNINVICVTEELIFMNSFE